MISHDGGKNFLPTNGGYSGRFANVIVSDRETPERIYAATINTTTGGGFLFLSTDNGETWRPSMRSMPPRLITYAIVQDARDANLIYLGTNLGVYRSLDRGASWAPVWTREQTCSENARQKESDDRGSEAAPVKPNETIRKAQQALERCGL